MDPGRARIGHDDAGGAEDRQAADDAEPAVERLRRERFAAGNGDLDLGVGGAAGRGGDFGDGVADHAARHRIDGGLARRQRAGRRASRCRRPRRRETSRRRPARRARTVAQISAPWVTSGSSPASLTTPAVAEPSSLRVIASAKLGRSPRGNVTSTGSGNSPVTSAAKAAFAAAAAQVPVVHPRRNGRSWPCVHVAPSFSPARRHRHHGSVARMTAWDALAARRERRSGLRARPCLARRRRAGRSRAC